MVDEADEGQINTDAEDQETKEDVKEEKSEEGDKSLLNTGDKDKDDKADTDEDSDADKSKDEGAPETYEDFSLPEGFEANNEILGDFTKFAKEHDMSQADAQKLIDMQTKVQAQIPKMLEAEWDKTQDKWQEATKNDKEYGGKELDTSLSLAKKALDKYASDEFREALEVTGMGNHPELIRMLVNVGKGISEDDVLTKGTAPGGDKSAADILFPDMAKGDN